MFNGGLFSGPLRLSLWCISVSNGLFPVPMDNDDNMESAPRMAWESDDQWALRDLFIRRHANSISDRDRLICLSQLFINIEFLGCQ